jgi:hypothetical protein
MMRFSKWIVHAPKSTVRRLLRTGISDGFGLKIAENIFLAGKLSPQIVYTQLIKGSKNAFVCRFIDKTLDIEEDNIYYIK